VSQFTYYYAECRYADCLQNYYFAFLDSGRCYKTWVSVS
jgi:hypothetical protein